MWAARGLRNILVPEQPNQHVWACYARHGNVECGEAQDQNEDCDISLGTGESCDRGNENCKDQEEKQQDIVAVDEDSAPPAVIVLHTESSSRQEQRNRAKSMRSN